VELEPLDPKAFKEVLSRFASGVTVVTTLCEGRPHGLTVSAFNSVSAEPPLVLVCLANKTRSRRFVEQAGVFAVHILGRSQAALGPRFARLCPGVDDPFAGLSYRRARTGAPILDDCLAWIDCSVQAAIPAGDHTLFVGAVELAAHLPCDDEPVLYYRRGFRVLEPGLLEP
jgi:flavin reductase (DIM6/NTAB) family NADH-FMN oxidoreductase RutF